MKQKILYTCEICHTDYKDKLAAERCEKHHKQKLKIIDRRDVSLSLDESGLPVNITIQTGDGVTAIYSRYGK